MFALMTRLRHLKDEAMPEPVSFYNRYMQRTLFLSNLFTQIIIRKNFSAAIVYHQLGRLKSRQKFELYSTLRSHIVRCLWDFQKKVWLKVYSHSADAQTYVNIMAFVTKTASGALWSALCNRHSLHQISVPHLRKLNFASPVLPFSSYSHPSVHSFTVLAVVLQNSQSRDYPIDSLFSFHWRQWHNVLVLNRSYLKVCLSILLTIASALTAALSRAGYSPIL